jgi:magnesium-protoporphyrin O-methyltransferase
MHAVGQFFPRSDRSPAIIPIPEATMQARIQGSPWFDGWEIGRSQRIAKGFYTSQALELRRCTEIN